MSANVINRRITNNYPVFEGSQVLTSDQLNGMFDYLDERDRYTRSHLIGIGIACGLNVAVKIPEGDASLDGTTGQRHVNISEGIGITSDGYLVRMPDCTMKYVRDYQLPKTTVYEPFGNYSDNVFSPDNVDIKLYELLANKPGDGIEPDNIDANFLNDKYLLLFLECFDRDPRSCFGKKCEDLGKERIFTIRKLAVDKDGLDEILSKIDEIKNRGLTSSGSDFGIVENPFYRPSALVNIDLKKPLFVPNQPGSTNFVSFADKYLEVLNHSDDKQNVFKMLFGSSNPVLPTDPSDDTIPEDERISQDLANLLTEGVIHRAFKDFSTILNAAYDYKDPLPLTANGSLLTLRGKISDIFNSTDSKDYVGIQYIYEYFQLLIEAYDEFIEAVTYLVSVCKPQKYFPLHIMVGKIVYDGEKEGDEWSILGQSKYRHEFLQPRILNTQGALLKKVISLHKRLVLMVEKFDLDKISDLDKPDDKLTSLKITPSKNNRSLGERAIPVYFKVKEAGVAKGITKTTLEEEWNMEITTQSRGIPGKRDLRVLSYESNEITPELVSSNYPDAISAPLNYNTKGFDYRVEGIIGKKTNLINDVGDNLDESRISVSMVDSSLLGLEAMLRDTYHLPYEILKVQLTDDTSEVAVEEHYWQDLQSDYKLIKSGFQVTTRNFLDELDAFYAQSADWFKYKSDATNRPLPFVNLDNFLETIEDFQRFIFFVSADTVLTGLIVGGESLLNALPTTIQAFNELTQGNSAFSQLITKYKAFEDEVRRAYLGLKHAQNILLYEKIAVMPVDLFEDWNRTITATLRSFDLFLENQDLYQLYILYYRFNQRFNYLRDNHYSIFSNFLKYHPGITEGAIERGGTHLLIESMISGENRIVASFTLPYLLDPQRIHIPLPKSLNSNEDFPPLARGEALLVQQKAGNEVQVKVVSNDLDKNPTDLVVSTANQSAEGNDLEESDQIITFKPEDDFIQNDSFTRRDHFGYSVRNNFGEDQAKVEVLVVSPYEPHVRAIDNLASTNSFYPIEIDVLANDTTYQGIRPLLGSNLSRLGANIEVVNTKIRYTPAFQREGKDTFSYQIMRTRGTSPNEFTEVSEAKVEVVVFCCDRFELELICEGNEAALDVLTDSEKVSGYELKLIDDQGISVDSINTDKGNLIEVVTLPVGGGETILPPEQRIFYRPEDYFTGEEVFHYAVMNRIIINDGDGTSYRDVLIRRAQVRIRVLPCSETRFERTLKDTARNFAVLEAGQSGLFVFENRSTPIPNAQTPELSTPNGNVTVVSGVLRYTPNEGYYGWDEFSYSFLENGVRKYYSLQVLIDGYEKTRVAATFQETPAVLSILSANEISSGYRLVVYDSKSTINAGTNQPSSIGTDKEGTATVSGGNINYIPRSSYLGEDAFNYAVTLNGEVFEYGRYHVLVGPNKVSIAYTTRSQPITIDVIGGPNDVMIELSKPTSARGASLSIITDDGGNSFLRYTPTDDIIGQDTFDYSVVIDDEKIKGTVYVIVEDDQRVEFFSTFKNKAVEKVLFNSPVADENIEIIFQTSGSFALIDNNQKLRYDPVEDFIGIDRMEYRAVVNGQVEYGKIFFLVTCECEDLKISGTVKDELGDVGGALVTEVLDGGVDNEVTATSGGDGSYMIQADGSNSLRFSKDTHEVAVPVPINGQIQVDGILRRKQVTIGGVVTDNTSPTPNPIDNFSIEYLNRDRDSPFIANGSNAYSVDVFVETDLIFSAPGYKSETRSTSDATNEGVLDVQLIPNRFTVRGKVTDELGNELEDVTVSTDEGQSTKTNQEGRYELLNVSGNTEINYQTDFYEPEMRVALSETDDLDVTLIASQLKVFCTVRDKGSARPLYGAIVTINRSTPLTFQTEERTEIGAIITDTLSVTVNGFVSQDFNVADFPFDENNETDLTVDLDAALITVSGFVRLTGGNIVVGAMVSYNDQFSEESNSLGRYTIEMPLFEALVAKVQEQPDILDSAATYLVEPTTEPFIQVDTIPVSTNNTAELDLIMTKVEWETIEGFSGKPLLNTSFAIQDKFYILLGGGSQEVHEYDTVTGKWSRKADFAGISREYTVSFVLDGLAYVGLGRQFGDSTNILSDFWSYDPTADAWSRQRDMEFPVGLTDAAGMVIDGQAYVGLGLAADINEPISQFWMFDDAGKEWIERKRFPGAPRFGAAHFSLDRKGYVGLGNGENITLKYKDLWEYDPVTDEWQERALFPGEGRSNSTAVRFDLNNVFGVVGTGEIEGLPSNDMWLYHAREDRWIRIDDLPEKISLGTGIGINGAIYVGTGQNDFFAPNNLIWVYRLGSQTLRIK